MFAMSFEIISKEIEMGLNLEKEEGLDSFGISARKEELLLPPRFPFFWMKSLFLKRSFLIKAQRNL